jgi:hypothetical protein
MKDTAETVWNAIKGVAETVWNGIKKFIEDPIKAVSNTLSFIWNGIQLVASTVWDGIKTAAEKAWNAIKSFISDPISAVSSTLTSLWDGIKSAAITAWEALKGALEPIITPIKNLIEGVTNTVKGVIDWFKKLMGFDGQNLSDTTSTHTNYIYTKEIKSTSTDSKGNVTTEYKDGTNKTEFKNGGVAGGASFAKAKGDWYVPYDDYPAVLHRGEAVLTASQARKYRDGEGNGIDLSGLGTVIVEAIREGMANAQVNSYLDGRKVTEEVNRITGNSLMARRYAP